MIRFEGIDYWTTEELYNSLAARCLVEAGGSRKARLRRAQRWAKSVDLRPSGRTPTGGLLWGDEEVRDTLARQ